MKCIYCGRDSIFKERGRGTCPGCRKKFAFEPKSGDPFTDPAFKAAIDAVSANGQIRWGLEHLFYELCRRAARRSSSLWYFFVKFVLLALFVLAGINLLMTAWTAAFMLLTIGVGIWRLTRRVGAPTTIRLPQSEFDGLWGRWVHAHGNPPGLIVRKTKVAPRRAKESDIGDYSFDRAVICDRRTVDLLIANNFHFENNCAVLSIGGYPEGPFELVRTMLKRNPKLQVFALHDASVPGCQLAFRLANDDSWFKGHAAVTDVGLRPRHARPFQGLLQAAEGTSHLKPGEGILADEIDWLNQYVLELAAIRPEQILKRLFKAINRREESGSDSGTNDGSSAGYYSDDSSFSSQAGDSDGGADSFG